MAPDGTISRGHMISVFRIYLGRAWHENGAAGQLRTLFDTLPEFLHSVIVVEPEASDTPDQTDEARRAAARVAMTQAHVAILWGGPLSDSDAWTAHEIHIARTGFRRRIPIIAVTPPDGVNAPTFAVRAADRIERWHAPDIACAVQELAESAAAERRTLMRQLALEAQTTIPATLSPTREAGVHMPARALPMTEIAEAFASLRTARAGGTAPPKGSA